VGGWVGRGGGGRDSLLGVGAAVVVSRDGQEVQVLLQLL
jgi:hypothetical protein